MKGSRFSEEQIISILRAADGESAVKAVCAKYKISDATRFAAGSASNGGRDVF